MQNRPHDPDSGNPEVAGLAGGREAATPSGGDSTQGGTQHGLRGRAGDGGLGDGTTPTPRHATRYIETSRGILSYRELAPLLAERVAEVEQYIAKDGYVGQALDEHLILTLHGDIVAALVPTIGGKWRIKDVRIGDHEPPPFRRVPELMREYARDLVVRIDNGLDDDERLLETLAFAEGRLLSIHPFEDFNGRATRAFLSELLRRLNLPEIDPTPYAGAQTDRYLDALAAADRHDWRPLMTIWRERLEADEFFSSSFEALTGHKPMPWQSRLFRAHLLSGDLPSAVSIPTGLGKTAVMAIWLIALAWQCRVNKQPALARRLVYVVDRRAVVDQSTDFAEELRERLALPEAAELRIALGFSDNQRLAISTLRGQFVDNRKWLEDPSRPAIIIGTVDMIGSRLLFEGYGVSRKMRPYHAGLLGADALVLLDEAHLVPPFEALLASIANEHVVYGARSMEDRKHIPAFKLLPLSATHRSAGGTVFALEAQDYESPDDEGAELTRRRLEAEKSLTIVETADAKGLPSAIADQAWKLSGNGQQDVRCLVFCNSRDDAQKVFDDLKKRLKSDDRIELFVGARRVRERQNAQERLEKLGFLAGSNANPGAATFLMATSAGEVGVDLDADHMVCDLVAWERMVQRFGRVNRRGKGKAKIVVVDADEPVPKNAAKPTSAESVRIKIYRAVKQVLDGLECNGEGRDVSPNALRVLTTKDGMRGALLAATTPPPLRPALSRPLVDAWAMTSLLEHTGRPEIEPWLRGWVDDLPQTTVAWRKHLPVREMPSMSKQEIEGFFEAAPLHASEMLETESYRVMAWLKKRVEHLKKKTEPAASEWKPDAVLGMLLGTDRKLVRTLRLHDFRDESKDEKKRLEHIERDLSSKTLVMAARFGGLQDGLLNETSSEAPAADAGSDWGKDDEQRPLIRFRIFETGPESGEPGGDWRENHRFDLKRSTDGEATRWLSIQKWRDTANTEDDRAEGRPQSLAEHQNWTAERARTIGERLGLPGHYTNMLAIAARLHDEGKRAAHWQRAFRAERDARKFKIDGPLAKTRGPINQAVLDGYRHEFGSLPEAMKDEEFKKLPKELQDLALHLIAAHHGFARPLIATQGCEDAPPSVLEERAREVALRFARLQKRWGPWGLAWWEALLRAADAQASRANDESGSDD